MSTEEIAKAHKRFQQASDDAEALRQERNDLIRAAVANGASMTDIARAIGCSRARIAQIVDQT